MYSKLFISGLLASIILSSCSMYKTGQTPDDLYYAPTQLGVNRNDEITKNNDGNNQSDDNYLRMKVRDRNKWNRIDDKDYWYNYNSYSYYDNYSYNSWSYNSWNPFTNNNYYNCFYNSGYYGLGYWNPFFYVPTVKSNTGPKPYMDGYINHSYSNTNNPQSGTSMNVKTGSGFGNFLKTIVGGSTTSNNNTSVTNSSSETYSRPVRTFSGSSSSSTSNSSSGRRTSTGSSSTSGRGGKN